MGLARLFDGLWQALLNLETYSTSPMGVQERERRVDRSRVHSRRLWAHSENPGRNDCRSCGIRRVLQVAEADFPPADDVRIFPVSDYNRRDGIRVSAGAPTPTILPTLWTVGALMVLVGGLWFFFFLRVNVAHDGASPFHLGRADLFIGFLLASIAFALLWHFVQTGYQSPTASRLLFGIYIF